MDLKILYVTAFLGTVFAKTENNIYIPLVKVQTDTSEESEKQCVTKEYIDEMFVNISNREEKLYSKCASERETYATKENIAELTRQFINISAELTRQLINISAMISEQNKPIKRRDCEDIQNNNERTTGIYTIYPNQNSSGISVRCDMDTAFGGWTVIQRRVSDSDFYKTWDEYAAGFGNLSGNFWLGNRAIHMITSLDKYELRVDLSNYDGETAYAHYRQFSVGDADSGYRLFVEGFSGTAGDSLAIHNGMKFSTYDSDNDAWGSSCAIKYYGAWWYKDCHEANLNGNYGNTFSDGTGMSWKSWKGNHVPMKTSEMKIRRVG